MRIGDIFNHRKENLDKLLQKRRNVAGQQEETRVEIKCPECGAELRKDTKNGRLKICPDCGKYLSLTPCERIELIADEKGSQDILQHTGRHTGRHSDGCTAAVLRKG